MRKLFVVIVLSLISTVAFAKDVKDSPDDVAVFLSYVDTNMNTAIVSVRDAIHAASTYVAKATAPVYRDGTVVREVIISKEQDAVLSTARVVCLSAK